MKWEGIKFLSNDTLKEESCQNHFQSGEGSIGKYSERKGRKYSSNEKKNFQKQVNHLSSEKRYCNLQIRKESLLTNFLSEEKNIITQKGEESNFLSSEEI